MPQLGRRWINAGVMFRTADIESVNECWDAALNRLKEYVEAGGQEKLLVALTMERNFAGEESQTIDEDDDMLSAFAPEGPDLHCQALF